MGKRIKPARLWRDCSSNVAAERAGISSAPLIKWKKVVFVMKVCVLNGSPAGENSITLQTVHYIQKYDTNTGFEILDVGKKIRSYEKDFTAAAKSLGKADLILFVIRSIPFWYHRSFIDFWN